MAYTQELKNLVAEIKVSHKDRTAKISEIKKDSGKILKEADDYMNRVNSELKEMAKELKEFLTKNAEERKKNFKAMMEQIRAELKDIKDGVKGFLTKSEEKRIVDFKALMKDLSTAVEANAKSTRNLLGNYKAERKEAAGYWVMLKKKGVAVADEKVETPATQKVNK